MPDINIAELRSDVLDRMDNSVILQDLPEGLRIKLQSETRVTYALNQGILLFCRDADPSTISQLVSIVTASADTNIGSGGDGVAGGMKTYLWPSDAFGERRDGGVIKLIINEKEHAITAQTRVSVNTLRYMGSSPLYEDSHDSFAIDIENKRIYTLSGATLKARIVEEPGKVDDNDQYVPDSTSTIPISNTFIQTISQMAFQELIKMGQNFSNRNAAINATTDGQPATPEQEGQPES